jgi:hypothetical protein
MKKLDGNGPALEVAQKLKIIKSFQPQIQDMERRMAILKQVEPILESAIRILASVINLKAPTPKPKPIPQEPAADSSLDLESLLASVAAPSRQDPPPDQRAVSDLLGGLSLAQLSGSGGTGPQSGEFDSNPQHGKDSDGFEELVLLDDQST